MIVTLLATATPSLPAQGPARSAFGVTPHNGRTSARPYAVTRTYLIPADTIRRGSATNVAIAGFAGSIIGGLTGAAIGSGIERLSYAGKCYEDCGLAGSLYGMMIGQAIGFGVASSAARPTDSKPKRILLPIAAAGALYAFAFSTGEAAAVLGIIPLQIITLSF